MSSREQQRQADEAARAAQKAAQESRAYHDVGPETTPEGRALLEGTPWPDSKGGGGAASDVERFNQKWESKVERPPEPTIKDVPTTPDRPGGQVATVDGKKVYTEDSTMRNVYGFETQAQYLKAQRQGYKPGTRAFYGPLVEEAKFTGTEEEYGEYLKDFKALDKKIGTERAKFESTLKVASPDLYMIYKRDGYTAYQKAYKDYMADFKAKHLQLPDNQWIVVRSTRDKAGNIVELGWNDIPGKYRSVGLKHGYSAMVDAINADKVSQEKAVATMDKYKTDTGYDLLTAVRKGVKPETMELAGFEDKDIEWATSSLKAARATKVALPGEKSWYNLRTGEVISDAAYQSIVSKKHGAKDEFTRATPEVRRMAVEGIATIFFTPARMALPEVKAGDIKPTDYAVGSGQLALWAIPFLPKGVTPYALAGSGAILGYEYAKQYPELSTGQRIAGGVALALIAAPTAATIIKKAIPVAVKVPTATGEVTVWKGINIAGKPVIGISKGKPTIGTKGVTYPEAAAIKPGYEPVTKIETSVMGTRSALKKMGVAEADIAKVENTLDTRAMFAGKKSPYLTKDITAEPIKSLSREGVGEVFKTSIAHKDKVEKIYGSYTMKSQLEPSLRQWRKLGDIDIQTKMSQPETEAFTRRLVTALEKTEGKGNVRVSAESPTLIETRANGKWRHAVDIHSYEVVPGSEAAPAGAYGLTHAERAVKVRMPGVGELRFMRLSETGKRKVASILEFQEGKIGPKQHRIKDIADYYVILRTFKGQDIADDWARAFGQKPDKLLKLAEKSPPKLLTWEFSPLVAGKGKPSVAISPPSTMYTRISPSLRRKLSYSPLASPSVALSSPLISVSPSAYAVKPSKAISKMASLSGKASARPLPSPEASPVPSPSPRVSPKPSPSISPVASPSLSAKPSPSPSPTPSPSPSPSPSPVPTPTPIPEPEPIPRLRKGATEAEKRKLAKETPGTVAWNMGKLGKPLKDVWHVRFPDGKHLVLVGKKPEGVRILAEGPGSAYKTTQVTRGILRREIKQKHGAVTATIRPATTPKGATIGFAPLKSVKRGKIYYTPAGNATLMSRRPIGRRRR